MSAGPQVAGQAIQNLALRNSFNPIGAGARGLGMGGAFIAVADDGSAASFNPAGLAQLRRSEITLVGFDDRLAADLTFTRLQSASNESRRTNSRHRGLDFAGVAVPLSAGGRRLVLQFSYQRAVDLFGDGAAFVQDTVPLSELGFDVATLGLPPSFRLATIAADIRPKQSGAFHTGSVSAGYQLSSRLAVGTSINVWKASWTTRGTSDTRVLAISPLRSPLELLRVDQTFDYRQDVTGLNLTGGLLLSYSKVSLGAVLRFPFAGNYDLRQAERSTLFAGSEQLLATTNDVTLKSRLRWPRSAGLGIALRPFHGLTLAGDVSQANWSRAFLEDVPDGALLTSEPASGPNGEPGTPTYVNRNFFDLLPASETTTTNTVQWRAGAEYLVGLPGVVVPLRAGLFRDRSPILDPGTDSGRRVRGWTLGTGLNFSRLVFDVAFERRTSSTQVGLVFRGGELIQQANAPRESVKEDRLVASLIYRFNGADDPLVRALKFLFVGGGDNQDGPQPESR